MRKWPWRTLVVGVAAFLLGVGVAGLVMRHEGDKPSDAQTTMETYRDVEFIINLKVDPVTGRTTIVTMHRNFEVPASLDSTLAEICVGEAYDFVYQATFYQNGWTMELLAIEPTPITKACPR